MRSYHLRSEWGSDLDLISCLAAPETWPTCPRRWTLPPQRRATGISYVHLRYIFIYASVYVISYLQHSSHFPLSFLCTFVSVTYTSRTHRCPIQELSASVDSEMGNAEADERDGTWTATSSKRSGKSASSGAATGGGGGKSKAKRTRTQLSMQHQFNSFSMLLSCYCFSLSLSLSLPVT